MRSIDSIPDPAMMEGLAEEASELAQAALKVARVLRAENPTPMNIKIALGHFTEETADVLLYLQEVRGRYGISLQMISDIMTQKQDRWKERMDDSF